MSFTYKYHVRLTDYDDARVGELRNFLRTLNNKLGNEALDQILEEASEGDGALIFDSNSLQEAKRIGHAVMMKGGVCDIAEEDSDEEEED